MQTPQWLLVMKRKLVALHMQQKLGKYVAMTFIVHGWFVHIVLTQLWHISSLGCDDTSNLLFLILLLYSWSMTQESMQHANI